MMSNEKLGVVARRWGRDNVVWSIANPAGDRPWVPFPSSWRRGTPLPRPDWVGKSPAGNLPDERPRARSSMTNAFHELGPMEYVRRLRRVPPAETPGGV